LPRKKNAPPSAMALSGLLNLSQPLASAQLHPPAGWVEGDHSHQALIEDTSLRVLEGIERVEQVLEQARSLEGGADERFLAEEAFLKELLARAQQPLSEDIVHKNHRQHDEDYVEEEEGGEVMHESEGHHGRQQHHHDNRSDHGGHQGAHHGGGGHHNEIPEVR
jgi:hypothetical protein